MDKAPTDRKDILPKDNSAWEELVLNPYDENDKEKYRTRKETYLQSDTGQKEILAENNFDQYVEMLDEMVEKGVLTHEEARAKQEAALETTVNGIYKLRNKEYERQKQENQAKLASTFSQILNKAASKPNDTLVGDLIDAPGQPSKEQSVSGQPPAEIPPAEDSLNTEAPEKEPARIFPLAGMQLPRAKATEPTSEPTSEPAPEAGPQTHEPEFWSFEPDPNLTEEQNLLNEKTLLDYELEQIDAELAELEIPSEGPLTELEQLSAEWDAADAELSEINAELAELEPSDLPEVSPDALNTPESQDIPESVTVSYPNLKQAFTNNPSLYGGEEGVSILTGFADKADEPRYSKWWNSLDDAKRKIIHDTVMELDQMQYNGPEWGRAARRWILAQPE